MNVYLVNDCSYWPGLEIRHGGCKAIMDSFRLRLEAAGHRIVHVCPRPEGPVAEKIKDCDWVLVNGEGTFRDEKLDHEPGRIRRLREGMELALDMGKRVSLVNSVWCRMGDGWEDLLFRLSDLSAREPESARQMSKACPNWWGIEVHPDESYFLPLIFDAEVKQRKGVVMGDIWNWNMPESERSKIYLGLGAPTYYGLSGGDWAKLIWLLRSAAVYVTGQHHGVYAACRARCPFVCGKVNTHKLSSLFEWAGVKLPFFTTAAECIEQVGNFHERMDEFEKLFQFLEEQKPWPIPVS
jgi:hypothetical protein